MVKEDTRSKRQAIIEAARNIFAMKGYEDTTIAEIADDAGVAVGTVYLYFHNKREIYTSVSLDQIATLAAVMGDPKDCYTAIWTSATRDDRSHISYLSSK